MAQDHAAYMRDWRKRNPERIRAIERRYREKLRASGRARSGLRSFGYCRECKTEIAPTSALCVSCYSNARVRSMPLRLLEKVKVGDGCWEWTGSLSKGYGSLQGGRRGAPRLLAHRAIYELLIGPIPIGLEMDHLCPTKRCVRPDHLEPVTHRENMRRWSARRVAAVAP